MDHTFECCYDEWNEHEAVRSAGRNAEDAAERYAQTRAYRSVTTYPEMTVFVRDSRDGSITSFDLRVRIEVSYEAHDSTIVVPATETTCDVADQTEALA